MLRQDRRWIKSKQPDILEPLRHACARFTIREVDKLLRNARLRDGRAYLDESVHILDCRRLPTDDENEFLEQMLAWERAPVLPISKWFDPELTLHPPDKLSDAEVRKVLTATIERLYSRRIVLDFTDHLNDRQLYCLIARDILPSPEKKLDLPRQYLHWHFLDVEAQPETWLAFYASDEERDAWASETAKRRRRTLKPPIPANCRAVRPELAIVDFCRARRCSFKPQPEAQAYCGKPSPLAPG
jgi:hypothetical protein